MIHLRCLTLHLHAQPRELQVVSAVLVCIDISTCTDQGRFGLFILPVSSHVLKIQFVSGFRMYSTRIFGDTVAVALAHTCHVRIFLCNYVHVHQDRYQITEFSFGTCLELTEWNADTYQIVKQSLSQLTSRLYVLVRVQRGRPAVAFGFEPGPDWSRGNNALY